MESYYAHIENDIVTSVEVVTDEFVQANPKRYKGTWKKVGPVSNQIFCGPGYLYLPEKKKIILPKPFESWGLSDKDKWEAPVKKPKDADEWDEKNLKWI